MPGIDSGMPRVSRNANSQAIRPPPASLPLREKSAGEGGPESGIRTMAAEPRGYSMVWGGSAVMLALRERVERVAESDCSVLLTGETGTGKGKLARFIHDRSRRVDSPFIHVDCAALSPSVIESELFGHERGAFTDAAARRLGRFELAGSGTVFLDEVAELPPVLQAKLLRVLQDRAFERVGGTETLCMRARVLAATNRSLGADVAGGLFRADLYYRLAVMEFEIPPLRERAKDLVDLIAEIRREIASRLGRPISPPTPAALERLAGHSWPGNVRELINFFERTAACWPGESIDDRLAAVALGSPGPRGVAASPRDEVGEVDLAEALGRRAGNVSRTARELGLPRSTLRYRLARLAPDSANPSGPEGIGAGATGQLSLPLSRRDRGGAL